MSDCRRRAHGDAGKTGGIEWGREGICFCNFLKPGRNIFEVFMFVLSNFIVALARILEVVLTIYMWIIIFRAVISWVNPDPYNKIVLLLYRLTEPVLGPVRRKLPWRNMGIDLSPIIVMLVILFLQYFLVESIIGLARRL
jgi:YggT family protein